MSENDCVRPAEGPDPAKAGNPDAARYELELARARLQEAATHLQLAGHVLVGDQRAAAAIALGDCSYTMDRVQRILSHLRMGSAK